jgi:large subunit ribosomal protein L31e
MAKKESKSTIERDYVIPLRKGFRNIVSYKKTPRAIREIKAFLVKHTKADEVKIGLHLNHFMWKSGIKNPPPKVKVHVTVADGVAKAELFGKAFKGAVQSEKKKEPETLKDKLTAKLGGEEKKPVAKELKEEETLAEPKPEAKPEPETKPAEKPVSQKKPVQKAQKQ